MLIGISALIFDIKVERGHVEVGSPRTLRQRIRRMATQATAVVVILMIIAVGLWRFWPASNYLPTPLTMQNLFETDFNSGGSLRLQPSIILPFLNAFSQKQIVIPMRILTDTDGQSRFLAFYIPTDTDQFYICSELASRYRKIVENFDNSFTSSVTRPGDSDTYDSKSFPLSGGIYIYTETDFSSSQKSELQIIYRKNLADKVTFRGRDYSILHQNDKREPPARVQIPFRIPMPRN